MTKPPLKRTTLLLLREGDNILLAMKKRGFGAGYYNGIGGKIEPDETIEQALIRESQEEIGVTPLQYEHVAEHTFLFPDHLADIHMHAYVCRRWDGRPAESDEMAPEWFHIGDIPYEQMWQDDIVWLPQVLLGRKLRCQFDFSADNQMRSARFDIVPDLSDTIR